MNLMINFNSEKMLTFKIQKKNQIDFVYLLFSLDLWVDQKTKKADNYEYRCFATDFCHLIAVQP